ncbi:MAG: CHASE3 domain-containing protein [Gemmatimonadota bacterium]|nr:CHASE3 domain-containing protein [Gemmatimonadota bacterium]
MTDLRSGSADRRANREPPRAGVRLTTLQRLGATGGIAFIVMLLGLLTFDGINSTRDARDVVAGTHRVIEATQATLQDVTNAETGQRGYLLTNDERYLGPYHSALLAITSDTATLRQLAGADVQQRLELDTLSRRIDFRLGELAKMIRLSRAGMRDSALALVTVGLGKNAMDDIRATLRVIGSRQEALLSGRTNGLERRYRIVEATVIGGTIAAVLIALFLNTLLTRFAFGQATIARRLDAQNAELADANRLLGEQTVELELQNQQLQDQAAEMETQQVHLEEQASELEMQNQQLQEQATELEAQAEELGASVEALQEQTTMAEEATGRAEEANRAKSLFLTTMSHELRTPLNAIGGYVDLLALEIRGPLVEPQREDLRRIKKSGQYLLSLINDILNLAKIESGQLDLHIRDVSLATVFENVDALVAPQFNSKKIRYSYPRCDASLRVRADSEKLQQILLNVLSNACKFTNEGGNVEVECDADSESADEPREIVSVAIRDTGRGIAIDKLEEIFEPFVQIDRHLTGSSQQGVGLGLAISRDLARSMNGDLVAESMPGVGTTFVLTLLRGTRGVSAPGSSELARGSSDAMSAG